MEHSFDIDIATKYGIAEAVLFKNISFWVKKNRANNENYYANTYWTYNSIRAYRELFPYLTTYQVRRALKHLIDSKMIVIGNFNKSNYDRTSWYSIGEEGINYIDYDLTKPLDDLETSIIQNQQMEDIKSENEFVENHQPIPYINTYINTNKKDDDEINKPTADFQDKVSKTLQKYGGMNINAYITDTLDKSDIPEDLKVEAIERWIGASDTSSQKLPSANYLKKILANIKKSGATTVEELEAYENENKKSNSDRWYELQKEQNKLKQRELDLKEKNRPYYQMQVEMQSGKAEQKKQEEEKNKDYFKLHDAYIKGEISREEVLKSGIEEVNVQFWDAEIFNNTPEEIELQKKWEEHLKAENEMKKERKKW